MVRPVVALVTESRYEAPAAEVVAQSSYVANLLADDAALAAALEQRGLSWRRVDWARAEVDWSEFALVLLRTPWDYPLRVDEFHAWLERLEGRAVRNRVTTIRWNLDKRYLLACGQLGVPVVPTEVVARGAKQRLDSVLAARDWQSAVIKPLFGAGGLDTYRVERGRAEDGARFDELSSRLDLMVQPFAAEVLEWGEVSLVWIDGAFTHAVRKRARPGEFRVQDDYGGSVEPHSPSTDECGVAERALTAAQEIVGEPFLYARVDLLRWNGEPTVIELELVEPELWLRNSPVAAERLAAGVAKIVGEPDPAGA